MTPSTGITRYQIYIYTYISIYDIDIDNTIPPVITQYQFR